MKDVLKCYVSGRHLRGETKEGLVSFAVPEFGVLFRCGAQGNKADLEIIAFLTFLRFVEHNKDVFESRELLVFTDFPLLVYLLNKGVAVVPGMEAVVAEAAKYTKQFTYMVRWIDPKENRAAGSVVDIPQMPANSRIKIKTFANLNVTRPAPEAAPQSGDFKI